MLRDIEREFPSFRIVEKAGDPLSYAIDKALRALTLGKQRHYLSRYHTVIGYTLYVPSCWGDEDAVDKIILLRHERVHLRQRKRYGMLSMSYRYLLWPLPVGLAYGRARIEWEAYEETLRATYEWYGEAGLHSPALRRHIIERFTGPDYLWMWPFRKQLERWYDEAVAAIVADG